MKNKKGAVELSINTIVILFLALAMLGVGMFMISKLREGFESVKLDELNKDMVNLMYEKLQSGPEKLKIDNYEIKVKKGAVGELYYGVKNVEDIGEGSSGTVFSIDVKCPLAIGVDDPGEGGSHFDEKELKYLPKLIPLKTEERDVQKIIIQPSSSKMVTTYTCIMTVSRPENTEYAKATFSIVVI
jgi:hypothetical protein